MSETAHENRPPICNPKAKRGWPKRFLKALGILGTVSHACKAAKVNRRTVERLKDCSPPFREAWDKALVRFADKAEQEMFRRAIKGVTETVYQGGKRVGTRRIYSDSLLQTVIKAKKPLEYRERQTIEHVLPQAEVNAQRQRAILADPELARLACAMDERMAQLEAEAHLRVSEDRTLIGPHSVPVAEQDPASVIIDVTPSVADHIEPDA